MIIIYFVSFSCFFFLFYPVSFNTPTHCSTCCVRNSQLSNTQVRITMFLLITVCGACLRSLFWMCAFLFCFFFRWLTKKQNSCLFVMLSFSVCVKNYDYLIPLSLNSAFFAFPPNTFAHVLSLCVCCGVINLPNAKNSLLWTPFRKGPYQWSCRSLLCVCLILCLNNSQHFGPTNNCLILCAWFFFIL